MKTFNITHLLLFPLAIALSCSTPKTKNELNSIASILVYKDSVDRSVNDLQKNKSLPYTTDDYTFLLTSYSRNDKTVMLIEKGESGEFENKEKRYYLKNGNLVLYTETVVKRSDSLRIRESRAFYSNGRHFLSEIRGAGDTVSLAERKFQRSTPLLVNVKKTFKHFHDALNQKGQFDLAFEAIVEYPKARYIVLQHPNVNPYRSSLLIRKQDDFISELIKDPADYRGRKLKMSWRKQGDEYVYLSGEFR